MPLRDKTIVVRDEGRDVGKTYLITELPAYQAEKWAMKVFLALARGGADVPEGIADAGLAGLAQLTLRAFSWMRWEDAEPLLDEMMGCVQFLPTPGRPEIRYRLGINADDVEEPATLLRLRYEVLTLHTGFSRAVALLRSLLRRASASNSSGTPTSPPQSPSSSGPTG